MSPLGIYPVPSRSPKIPQLQYQEGFGKEVSSSKLNPISSSSERKYKDGRVGLHWVGLGWVALGWVGFGWLGLSRSFESRLSICRKCNAISPRCLLYSIA